MKLRDIHDQVKANYESGEYEKQQNAHQSYNQNKQKINILQNIYPVWFTLLIATLIPENILISIHLGWLHLVFRIFLMINTIAVAYFLVKDFLMKQKSDNE